jgi:hypothetical protein
MSAATDCGDYPHAYFVCVDHAHLRKHSNVDQLRSVASATQRPSIDRWASDSNIGQLLVFGRARFDFAGEPILADLPVVYCKDAAAAVKALLQHFNTVRLASPRTIELTEYFLMLSDAEHRRVVKAALAKLPNCSEASKAEAEAAK